MDVPFFITRSSHYDPIVAVRFIVLFNAVTLGFQSVSGIGTQRSVDFISEGGRNDYPILIPKPQSEPHRLTFKRGYQMRKLSITGLLAVQIRSGPSSDALSGLETPAGPLHPLYGPPRWGNTAETPVQSWQKPPRPVHLTKWSACRQRYQPNLDTAAHREPASHLHPEPGGRPPWQRKRRG